MQRERQPGRILSPKAKVFMIAGLVFFSAAAPDVRQQQKAPRARQRSLHDSPVATDGQKVRSGSTAPLSEVPFAPGEILTYRLSWSVFLNAAAVQLAVVEKRDLFGTAVWHFRASAHSQVPLRSLAEIDDQFDSYADVAALESKQYETYLNELGEKQNTVSQLVSTRQPSRNRSAVVLVRPHTRDPLAALYVLRTVDWRRTPEIRAPVYDGEDLYEIRARLDLADDVIRVGEKDATATKIAVQLFRGSDLSRNRCWIWLSQDAAKVPLVIQAQVPYGSVRAELVSVK